MEKLPNRISPCPIVEATVEMRFSSSLPKQAIFGIIYSRVKDDFNKVEKLPTAMLPNEVIENDPNLRYSPLYKITDGTFTAQIGFEVISLHSSSGYVGWKLFSEKIISFFKKIEDTNITDKVNSLVIRYLNFFEADIFQNINFQVQMLGQNHQSNNLVIKTEILEGNFVKVLQIANNITLTSQVGEQRGSLLEISCVMENPKDFFLNIEQIINEGHLLEKNLFFSLLTKKFLLTFNPEY